MEKKMRKVTVKLIKSSTDDTSRAFNLKSDKKEWTGIMAIGPSVGRSFCFYRDDKEYMHTSEVKNIEYKSADTLIITTRNSEYEIILGEAFND